MKKFLSFIIILLLSISIFFLGIKFQDHIEVENNATMICLSCIGIE